MLLVIVLTVGVIWAIFQGVVFIHFNAANVRLRPHVRSFVKSDLAILCLALTVWLFGLSEGTAFGIAMVMIFAGWRVYQSIQDVREEFSELEGERNIAKTDT